MASCHDMKKGEIYHCPDCGLELQVIAECTDCQKSSHDGSCECSEEDHDCCEMSCCGKPLVKK